MVGVHEQSGGTPGMSSEPESAAKLETSAKMKRRKAGIELGQRIEDFELQGFLGRGSYASVYKACSRHSNRMVAIKVIDKQLIAACPGLADRVRYEAQTHIALDHPCIVRLHTFFEDQSRVYFVMDLCEGGELYQYLRKRGKGLPVAEGRRMFEQVVCGVQHLHSQNIAHRDLKLSNLLLTSDLQVKVSDFGLSVTLAEKGGESGTVCGTPNYMAPEVICRAPHGLSSDVWALGCLLYTLLVGCPPFESSTVEATLQRISEVEYEIPAHVPAPAKDLIRRLLVKDPAARMSLESILSHDFVQDASSQQRSPSLQQRRSAAEHAFQQHHSSVSSSVTLPDSDADFPAPRVVPPPMAHGRRSQEWEREQTSERRGPEGLMQSVHCTASSSSMRGRVSSTGDIPGANAAAQRQEEQRRQEDGEVPAPSSSPSPHLSSGKALRDRLRGGQVSRSWDPQGAHGLRSEGGAESSKDRSGAERRPWDAERENGGADARDRLQLSLAEVRSSLAELMPHVQQHQHQHQHLQQHQRQVEQEEQRERGVGESSFASTLLSARSHKVATPVHSCRSVPGGGGPPDSRPEPLGMQREQGASGEGWGSEGGGVQQRIDAQRMKAHRYDTRHAEVVIDRQGTVYVIAKGSDAVMRVELGGEVVRVLNRRTAGAAAGGGGAERPGRSAEIEEERFSLERLPAKWRRLYAYAAKVLSLIQSKTPKVVYYSPLAKAQLMDDGRGGARASFVCDFYDGGKVQTSPGQGTELTVSQGGGSGDMDGVQRRAHALDCLQICRNAEAQCARSGSNMSGGSVDSSGQGRGPFPAVFAHKLAMHHLRADQAEAQGLGSSKPRAGSVLQLPPQQQHEQHEQRHQRQQQQQQQQQCPQQHKEEASGSVAGMSTTQLSVSVSDASQRSGNTSTDKRSSASTAASTAQHSPSHSHLLPPGDAGAEHAASRRQELMRNGARGCAGGRERGGAQEEEVLEMGGEGRVFEFEDAGSRPVVAKAAFFEGLGWMMRLQDGSVWGQLRDGSQVVATEAQVVAVTAEGERIAVPVEHGQLQDYNDASLSGRLRWSAQQVLSLREVL